MGWEGWEKTRSVAGSKMEMVGGRLKALALVPAAARPSDSVQAAGHTRLRKTEPGAGETCCEQTQVNPAASRRALFRELS